MVRLYCSLGNKCAPVEEWEDIALNESLAEGDETFWTALSDVLSASEFDSVVDRLSRGDSFVGNGSLDDGVLLTGQASGLAREGIVDDDDDSSDDEANDSAPTAAKFCGSIFLNGKDWRDGRLTRRTMFCIYTLRLSSV